MILDKHKHNIKIIDIKLSLHKNDRTIEDQVWIHPLGESKFDYQSSSYDAARESSILHTGISIGSISCNNLAAINNTSKFYLPPEVKYYRKRLNLITNKIVRRGNEDFAIIDLDNDMYKQSAFNTSPSIIMYSKTNDCYYITYYANIPHQFQSGTVKLRELVSSYITDNNNTMLAVISALKDNNMLPDDIELLDISILFRVPSKSVDTFNYLIENKSKLLTLSDFNKYVENQLPQPTKEEVDSIMSLLSIPNNVPLGINLVLNYNLYSCIFIICHIFKQVSGFSPINYNSTALDTIFSVIGYSDFIRFATMTEIMIKYKKQSISEEDIKRIKQYIIADLKEKLETHISNYNSKLQEFGVSFNYNIIDNE